MAATLGVMQSAMAVVSAPMGSLASNTQALRGGNVRLPLAPKRVPHFRCQANENSTSGLREAVDASTKKEITREDILRNQETNQSERQSVFGAVPSSGSLYPRPEIERRPETGDRSFASIFAFDGAAPETINGRLVSSSNVIVLNDCMVPCYEFNSPGGLLLARRKVERQCNTKKALFCRNLIKNLSLK